MEERPLETNVGHHDLSPEARRRRALGWRDDLQEHFDRHVGPGSRFFAVIKRVWTGAYYDGFIHAGNLAYMTILAVFPFFITMAAFASLVGEAEQQQEFLRSILSSVPVVVADVIEPVALYVMSARSGLLLWFGGIVGLWTVTSLIETIRDILHRAYGTPATHAFWRYRLLSSGIIFVAMIALIFSLLAQVAITAVQEAIAAWFPGADELAGTLTTSRLIPAGVIYLSIFLLFLSLTPEPYRGKTYPKWPGALLVTLWWVAVSIGLPWVLRLFFTYDLTYGSFAGVMIVLFFFWLVGLGMVIGAELNAALAETPEERALLGHRDKGVRVGRTEAQRDKK
jgi:membrane protein